MVRSAQIASTILSIALTGSALAEERKPVVAKSTAPTSHVSAKPSNPDKMVELKVQPPSLVLNGLTDARRLLVSARLADGRQVDVSRSAKLTALDDRIRVGTDGFLSPIKDGESRVRVEEHGLQAE